MLMKLESQPKCNEGMAIDRKEIHEPTMPCNRNSTFFQK